MADRVPIYVRMSRVQDYFGLHRATVYRMAERGEVTIHRIGGASLVRVDEMMAVIEGRDPDSEPPD